MMIPFILDSVIASSYMLVTLYSEAADTDFTSATQTISVSCLKSTLSAGTKKVCWRNNILVKNTTYFWLMLFVT